MLSRAYQYCNMIMLYLALAASLNVLEAGGATHIVGGSDGWDSFSNSLNWSREKEFHVGDVLVFNYKNDAHNVMQVNSTAYRKCIKNPYTRLFNSGHDSLVLSEVGKFWYICAVADHCENGQKLAIKVVL
ncbi:mavicyanin-like [Mangifera indica]|uniref:mavicyanin-like n=1 Tax=Mangifera indica TaxID=29780 RepID=UPI001CFAC621|nr:mavicyanin-like [Mangifera indica]